MKVHKDALHRARAEEAIRQTAYDLGVSAWLKIVVSFDETMSEDRVACTAQCDFEYRQASFLWNLPIVATFTDKELRDCAIHELVHALNAPIWNSLPRKTQDKLYKLNELATENVARAIQHLMEKKP